MTSTPVSASVCTTSHTARSSVRSQVASSTSGASPGGGVTARNAGGRGRLPTKRAHEQALWDQLVRGIVPDQSVDVAGFNAAICERLQHRLEREVPGGVRRTSRELALADTDNRRLSVHCSVTLVHVEPWREPRASILTVEQRFGD